MRMVRRLGCEILSRACKGSTGHEEARTQQATSHLRVCTLLMRSISALIKRPLERERGGSDDALLRSTHCASSAIASTKADAAAASLRCPPVRVWSHISLWRLESFKAHVLVHYLLLREEEFGHFPGSLHPPVSGGCSGPTGLHGYGLHLEEICLPANTLRSILLRQAQTSSTRRRGSDAGGTLRRRWRLHAAPS